MKDPLGKERSRPRLALLVMGLALFTVGLLVGRSDLFRGGGQDGIPSDIERSSGQGPSLEVPSPTFLEILEAESVILRQASFDQGMAFPPMKDTFTSFEQAWRISDKLTDVLALTRNERRIAQQEIDETKNAFADLIRRNADLVSEGEGPPGSVVIRIRPYIREGHSELEQLRERLRRQLPDVVGEELFGYFRWRSHLGAFGANEVELRFDNAGQVYHARRNSMTGAVISHFSGSEDELLELTGFTRSMLE